ncbi:HU family DNA-binding protein [Carboxylicivirga marina]|uniref:DUF4469 domain-containing protein n=1 Tax=Carboxylicivirga marina TaxID=2800988 RepID=A0ABS1HIQ9_9BACT|nr:DNA-binding domain-containing protein [Carboxylicivirga marina]MBK3517511.1 DUF4469 domain-containing protein [Carboxylicivirga marina]
MPLRYSLVPNTLKTKSGKYISSVNKNDSYTIEHVIEHMIRRGSTVTKAEALAVMEEFSHAIESLVSDGAHIKTELFNITPSIKGTFNDEHESFTHKKHQVKLNLRPGKRLLQIEQQIKVKQVTHQQRSPQLIRFIDLHTKKTDGTFTPGQVASIKGRLLKFDETDPEQGIFLSNNDGHELKIEHIVKNKPSELLFIFPEKINKSIYSISVKAKLPRTQSVRQGTLNLQLTVL